MQILVVVSQTVSERVAEAPPPWDGGVADP